MIPAPRLDQWFERLIRWSFISLFFFLPLLFYRQASEVFELPKMYFVYFTTVFICALWIGRMIIQKQLLIRKTPLDIPILLFLLSQIVSTFFSIDPHTSWFGYYGRLHGGLWSTISYTLLYYAFVSNSVLKGPSLNTQGLTLRNAILASAVLVSLYAALQRFGIDKNYWVQDVVNRVFSTQGQPNWLAAYLVMTLPLAWAMFITKDEGRRMKDEGQRNTLDTFSLWPLVLSLVFFLALLFTRSRSGMIGFFVMDIVFWILVLKGRFLKQFLITHCMLLALILSAPNPLRDTVSQRLFPKPTANSQQPTALPALEGSITLRKSAQGGTESGDIRRLVWSGAVDIARQYPLFGTGPETFAYTYWRVRPVEHNLTSEWNFLYNKAHNEWLNLAANTGLFGLGAHLLLLGWFTVWTLKTLKGPTLSAQGRTLIYSILAALFGLETVNFFGFSTVTVGTYSYLYMGLVVKSIIARSPELVEGRRGNLVKSNRHATLAMTCKENVTSYCLFLMLIVASLYLLSRVFILFLADLSYARGRNLLMNRYAVDALKPLESAVLLVPDEPTFRSALAEDEGLVAVSFHATNTEPELAEELKNESLSNFEIVEKSNPYHLALLKTQSRISYSLGVFDQTLYTRGIELSQKAFALAPTNPSIPYTIGIMQENLGKNEDAKQWYQKALDLKPDYLEAQEKLKTL